MAPVAAKLYEDREYGALSELIRTIGKWIMILSFPFVLIVIFAPDEILGFILGSRYEAGASLLVVLVFAQLLYIVFGVADQIFLMTGHHKDWLLISAGTFFLSLLLNLIFVPRYGLLGAAFVSLSSSLIVLLISTIRIGKLIHIWPYDRRHMKPLAAAMVTGILLYFVMPIFSLIPIYRLLLTATISLFAFGGMILLLGIDVEDRNLIRVLFLGTRSR
jgi:O-antigen/teichoic acid export membrane protein